jgi:hypothetical protein
MSLPQARVAPRARRGRQAALRPRLAALRLVLTQRRAASDRLRRSLWVSILAHVLLFAALVPLAMPRGEHATATREPLRVERVLLEVAQAPPPPPPTPEPEPEPEQPPEPEREAERLEFVRSHLEAAASSPDTHRISTQDQRVQRERHTPARSQIADGRAQRGTRSGSPQRAARPGSRPEQAAEPTPQSEHERRVEAQASPPPPMEERAKREASQPSPSRTPRDAREPSPASLASAASSTRQAVRPSQRREPGERSNWEPLAVRLTGLDPQAQPFPEAPSPDRSASPPVAQAPTHDQREEDHPQRERERRADQDPVAERLDRAPGSSQAQPETATTAVLAARPSPAAPEPPLEFLIEPLELMREQQERERKEHASEHSARRTRRDTPPGSARAASASSAGSEAAAGGSVVSPIEPPPALDVRAALATRTHPLAPMLQALDDQLRAAWELPFEIRVSGIVGTTGVDFIVDRRGRIHEISLIRPSGHPALDALALAAIPRRIESFRGLLDEDTLDAFPSDGLRVRYQFSYTDSPVAGIL